MNITREEKPSDTIRLGEAMCGDVIIFLCDYEDQILYLVGDIGIGKESSFRHVIDLEDGSVVVKDCDAQVVQVEGSFVCK